MRDVYSWIYKISGVTAAKTLMYCTTDTVAHCEVLRLWVGNLGNDTNEQWDIRFESISSLGTPTATTISAMQHEYNSGTALTTVKANVTASEPTYNGSAADLQSVGYEGSSGLAGYLWVPQPEEKLLLHPSSSWGLRLLTAIASTDIVVGMTLAERS